MNGPIQKVNILGFRSVVRSFSWIYAKESPFKTNWEELKGPVSSNTLGYHIREGEHGLIWEDWEIFLEFAKKSLGI